MKIIPAIDLMGGKCVRLRQGDFAEQKVYGDDPVAVAKGFEEAGIEALHIVDLDGARNGTPQNLGVLKAICASTTLKVDFGGGLRQESDLAAAFAAGAKQVTVGSIAVKSPDVLSEWVAKFGAEQFILGADARGGMVSVSGWQEGSGIPLTDFIEQWLEKGILDVLCTSIERDGMLNGPDLVLYKKLMARFPEMRLIASGGVSSLADLDGLSEAGLTAVVVGKAYYEGRISLAELGARC